MSLRSKPLLRAIQVVTPEMLLYGGTPSLPGFANAMFNPRH